MRRIVLWLTNNIIINNVAIFFGADKYMKSANNYWKRYRIELNKSHQQVAGYSHIKEVEETLDKIHQTLINTTDIYLKKGERVLDIGCGPGLFLMDFKKDYELHGIDLSSEVLKLAKQNNPLAILHVGDFMDEKFDTKFNLIYSVGMLLYIKRSEVELFFNKLYDMLEPKGLVLISYPHAICRRDLFYHDINYINYSPKLLNKLISKKFILIQNKHVVDDREISNYDQMPYKSSVPGVDRIYKNSSILIIRKK